MAAPTTAGACWALWTDDGLFCIARFCTPRTLARMVRTCKRWRASLRGVFMHLSRRQNVPDTWLWRTAASRPGRVLFARLELGMCHSGVDLGCYPNVTVLHICKGECHHKGDVTASVMVASAFPNIGELDLACSCCCCWADRKDIAAAFPRLRVVRGSECTSRRSWSTLLCDA